MSIKIEFESDECERCQFNEGTHVWISKGRMYFVCMQCYFELPISDGNMFEFDGNTFKSDGKKEVNCE